MKMYRVREEELQLKSQCKTRKIYKIKAAER